MLLLILCNMVIYVYLGWLYQQPYVHAWAWVMFKVFQNMVARFRKNVLLAQTVYNRSYCAVLLWFILHLILYFIGEYMINISISVTYDTDYDFINIRPILLMHDSYRICVLYQYNNNSKCGKLEMNFSSGNPGLNIIYSHIPVNRRIW